MLPRSRSLLLAPAGVAVLAMIYGFSLAGASSSLRAFAPVGPATSPADKIVALGRIEPFDHGLALVPATDADQARMATLTVKEGDDVRAHQVLATLDTAHRQRAAIAMARANLALAQSTLDRTIIKSADTIAVGTATLQLWQAERAKAVEDAERTDGLAKLSFSSRVDARAAEIVRAQAEQQFIQVAIALARAKATGTSGDLLNVEVSKAQVQSAPAQLAQAEVNYQERRFRHHATAGCCAYSPASANASATTA